jgi:hypothetical protein
MNTYTVSYQGMKSDRLATREFAGDSAAKSAMKWAREFVRESYRNEATARVYGPNGIAWYRNVHGKAVRS